jgi:hypothetical protein
MPMMRRWSWVAVAFALASALPALAQTIPYPAPLPSFRKPALPTPPPPAERIIESPAPVAAVAPPPAVPSAPTAREAASAAAAQLQPVTLTALITDAGAQIPDGLVWRIFDTRMDTSGQLALAASSQEATGHFRLAPGNYVVHVAYGRAQASETLKVQPGGSTKSIILDAGALRLNAAITGDVPIPINLLRFDVFMDGPDGARVPVAQNLSPNDLVTINAGTYHGVSRFGSVNAVVRADLRVEPGQITDATLYHRAAQTSFKLVTEPGGEAIADIEWSVKTPQGETVFSQIGAFPATVLAEGDYVVYAKRGQQVFNRAFQVAPSQAREIEVLTTVY